MSLFVLYIYGTVYNNVNRINECIESLSKIDTEKQFLIIDNLSEDGTFEKLLNLKIDLKLKQIKCSRGKGRQLAMEIAKEYSTDEDLFMYFDGDTIYSKYFINIINQKIKVIKKNEVFLNHMCYKNVNFKIEWKDLNNWEDLERNVHFLSEGFLIPRLNDVEFEKLYDNEVLKYNREKRYSHGFKYFQRRLKNQIDVFIAMGAKFTTDYFFYIKYVSSSNIAKPIDFLLFLYVKIYKKYIRYYKIKNNLEFWLQIKSISLQQ